MSTVEKNLGQRLMIIAKEFAEKKGWPWLGPVAITDVICTPQSRLWEIRTNTAARGGNVRILVADYGQELEVVESRYLAR